MKLEYRKEGEEVKENVWRGEGGAGAVCAWLLAAAAALLALLAAAADRALPTPNTLSDLATNPHKFNAELAHNFLVNLTSIGPRVSGSYECDVSGVEVAVAGLRGVAAAAGAHNAVDIDVHRSDGFFNLTFFDGMNNAYRGVVSVVGRVRGLGARPADPALLLNCHIDTVPDSPGGSDDGAGCAVAVEVGRALAARHAPLPAPLILLLNAAEETIMQGSHSFVTSHRWAGSARAFINVEACGAGGREVVFQVGAGRLVRLYAEHAPHPFASSLAQEVFQGGLVPADTDFRVFRDFGRIPGLDLAWHADGYVYHTPLDVARLAPPAVLQRTGDNIQALAHGILEDATLGAWGRWEPGESAPVFFDVLGRAMLCLTAPAALATAALLIAALALTVHLDALDAAKLHAVRPRWWYGAVCGAAGCVGAAGAGGAGAAALTAALLHAAAARMPYYSHPWLVVPLYVLPALVVAGAILRKGLRVCAVWEVVWAGGRAEYRAAAAQSGGALVCAGALLVCAVRAARSGFLPALWLAAHVAAQLGIRALPRNYRGVRCGVWTCTAASACAGVQTAYLAVPSLRTLVPIAGRAGTTALPVDVMVGVASALVGVSSVWWCGPVVVTARRVRPLAATALAVAAAAALWCLYAAHAVDGWPYAADRPQRLMVFHVSSTVHRPGLPPADHNYYWVPELDANTERTLRQYVAGVYREDAAVCGGWVYCGAPYFLPVRSLVRRGLRAPAARPAAPRLDVHTRLHEHGPAAATLTIHANGTGLTQTVVIVSVRGAAVTLADVGVARPAPPLRARHHGPDNVYFFSLTDSKSQPWTIHLHMQKADSAPWGGRGQVSVGGHALHGPAARTGAHRALLGALPPHIAPTGWGARLHLLTF